MKVFENDVNTQLHVNLDLHSRKNLLFCDRSLCTQLNFIDSKLIFVLVMNSARTERVGKRVAKRSRRDQQFIPGCKYFKNMVIRYWLWLGRRPLHEKSHPGWTFTRVEI